MACGCKKNKRKAGRGLVNRKGSEGKKTVKRALPLVTIRKRVSQTRKKIKKK